MSRSTSKPKKRTQPESTDELLQVFGQLRQILSACCPPLTASMDVDGRYELVSKKPVEFMGKKRPELYFGSAIIQSNYVGLYLMHVYISVGHLKKIGPGLLRTLKGKSCFHIKSLDNTLIKEIEAAVQDGMNCYRKMGFI